MNDHAVKIVTDSSANLLAMDGVEFASVPLKVIVGEREFADDATVDMEELYRLLEKHPTHTCTSCPSVHDWLEAFGEAKDVICITLASTMSGSCSTARIAKREYEALHHGRHVYLIDSLSIGPEMALLAERARALLLGGMSAPVVYRALIRYRARTKLVFSLSGLKNCAENGRVEHKSARGIGVMGVGAVGCASEEGSLDIQEKCRGKKQIWEGILRQMKRLGYAGGRILISHSGNEAGALELMRHIRDAFGSVDIQVNESRALCGYYAEQGSLLIGMEC